VFQALAEGLTDGAREALENLLTIDPALRRSRFAWLRGYAESPAPTNLLALLDRLEYVRGLGRMLRPPGESTPPVSVGCSRRPP
jgi:hypothetical protein